MLNQIPYGETTTYGALADELGNRALAQMVGQAAGHNPVSVIVPCHRVLGSDGKLTGYAGGLARKQFLLDLEEPADVKAGRLF
jgi:methylated-DNA-[protein]-cysteine S-methyltransferase